MTIETHLDIDPALVGELELATQKVPYVNVDTLPAIHTRLAVGGTEYAYDRSVPIKGHSAVLPGIVAELEAAGKRVLVAERDDRYLLYVA